MPLTNRAGPVRARCVLRAACCVLRAAWCVCVRAEPAALTRQRSSGAASACPAQRRRWRPRRRCSGSAARGAAASLKEAQHAARSGCDNASGSGAFSAALAASPKRRSRRTMKDEGRRRWLARQCSKTSVVVDLVAAKFCTLVFYQLSSLAPRTTALACARKPCHPLQTPEWSSFTTASSLMLSKRGKVVDDDWRRVGACRRGGGY